MRFRTMFLAAALMIATAFSAYAALTEPADTPWAVNVTDSAPVLVPVAESDALELIAPIDALALMPDDGSWQGCVHCADCYQCPPPLAMAGSRGTSVVAATADRERMRA